MFSILHKAILPMIKDEDGFIREFRLESIPKELQHELKFTTLNKFADGRSYEVVTSADVRDLDTNLIYFDQDYSDENDGIRWLNWGTLFCRDAIAWNHSNRQDPGFSYQLKIPIHNSVDRKTLKESLVEACRRYCQTFPKVRPKSVKHDDVVAILNEAFPCLQEVPFSHMPRFPAMFLQRSVEIDPNTFELTAKFERPKFNRAWEKKVPLAAVDLRLMSVGKAVQSNAFLLSLHRCEGAAVWSAKNDAESPMREWQELYTRTEEDGRLVMAQFNDGIRKAR